MLPMEFFIGVILPAALQQKLILGVFPGVKVAGETWEPESRANLHGITLPLLLLYV
jgi:hypothetical protein